MFKYSIALFFLTIVGIRALVCQETFPVNGTSNPNHTTYAFKNATVHIDHETVLSNATLVIQDGKISYAGIAEKTSIPANAVIIDLKGKHIYPSFIDLYSDYGIAPLKKSERGPMPQLESSIKGAYGWNQAIHSDMDAYKLFVHNDQKADEYRKSGFGAVLTSNKDGIVRGSGALITLANAKENECIVKDRAAGFYSFNKGSSTQDYPTSLTGSIALLRQTYYDAIWYKQNTNKTPYVNISLDMFNQLQTLPSIFEANDKYNVLRADKIGDEFKVPYIIKAGGNEYQRILDIQAANCKYILPLNFPDAYDVEDPYDAEQVSLTDLKHWEMAPTNPAAFEQNYIPFALTTADLKDKSQFFKNLRKAIQYGLTEKMALKALTTNPATFIGVQDKVGSLKAGMLANFFIASKSVFEEDATIYEHWLNGMPYKYSDVNQADILGNYSLTINNKTYKVLLEEGKSKVYLKDSLSVNASFLFKNELVTMSFPYDSGLVARLSGSYDAISKSIIGKGQLADGHWLDFTMLSQPKDTSAKLTSAKDAAAKTLPTIGKVFYPFTAYGEPLPESEGLLKDLWKKYKNRYSVVLIKDATIWTNEKDSILTEQDMYIVEGKIVRIAPNIDAATSVNVKIINAKGMHLTPGIIDEHSHIGLAGGVNEFAQASSAEVQMADVLNPEDINIYRQLAGGVTTAQLLHGSANPIGGQSALIKLRWGKSAEELKYEKADPFIKFALGENVKQSNFGDYNTVRFPQTRMGVEQVYYDCFTRAKAYKNQWNEFKKLTPKQLEKNKVASPRKDLELDALAEILDNKRFITCHSYVQSEVNMLLHVADSMQFKVNTLTHILEGYKLADKLKAHGTSASTFADWWAYKLEVMEAIPHNAALLTKMGINTSINSDDAEMGRRLNQEAAKSIKYGGLSDVEALKLVTLNPAKMLHIDDKVGSIKVGKIADLVLWTDNPLSIYAKVDKTIIDGQLYYDRDDDVKLRELIQTERTRLINKLITEKHKGAKVVKVSSKKQQLYHCDTMGE